MSIRVRCEFSRRAVARRYEQSPAYPLARQDAQEDLVIRGTDTQIRVFGIELSAL